MQKLFTVSHSRPPESIKDKDQTFVTGRPTEGLQEMHSTQRNKAGYTNGGAGAENPKKLLCEGLIDGPTDQLTDRQVSHRACDLKRTSFPPSKKIQVFLTLARW